MADAPAESETIADPVEVFKKDKVKREAKRKEVKVITEYVPETKAPAPEVDVDSIVDRVTQALFEKMSVRPLPPPPKKTKAKDNEVKKAEEPPPTKYFGWC